jgi:DNA-binding MarR family transcriptional regulator
LHPVKKMIDIVAKLSGMLAQTEESAKEKFDLTGLTLTQMNYLETINHLNNPNLTELASILKLSKPTVKVAIDKLIERNYVFKVQSDEDRRSAHLHLTERGEQINRIHDLAHKNIADSIVSKLNSEEQQQLIELLSKILS